MGLLLSALADVTIREQNDTGAPRPGVVLFAYSLLGDQV
jgi:hypothetical protein